MMRRLKLDNSYSTFDFCNEIMTIYSVLFFACTVLSGDYQTYTGFQPITKYEVVCAMRSGYFAFVLIQ